jgi:ABC-type uncharacterized transport system YnjBCD permease subunit
MSVTQVLQRDLAELLEVGDKNQRLLASETESICRTLLGADAQMAPVHSGVYDGQSWQRLQERCPELAKLGQVRIALGLALAMATVSYVSPLASV